MQLRSTIVAIVIAAAAGGAAVRAFGAHGPPDLPAALPGAGERLSAAPFALTQRTDMRKLSPGARAVQPGAASGVPAIVYVAGAVVRPGVYTLPASARANDALRAAGGPAPNADLVAVNLAARIADGDEIAVPLRGATGVAGGDGASRVKRRRSTRTQSGSRVRRRHKRRPSAGTGPADVADTADAPAEMVDVNAATEAELETLPGVGPALAERIVAFRDLNGPFASSDELLDVGGMTAAKVDALSPYVSFH